MVAVNKESLKEVGEQLGLSDAESKEKGRPIGAKGALPNLKTMTKKDLVSELGKARKKIPELEGVVSDLKPSDGSDVIIPPELWGVLPAVLYDYLASRFGPHWKLTENEVKLFGQSLEKVGDRYLAVISQGNPELFGLLIVLVSTAVPRVVMSVVMLRKGESDDPGKPD